MPDRTESSVSSAPQALDDEFVPLAVAAHVAYFQLMRASAGVPRGSALAEVTRLTAIALAQVAPIYASIEAGSAIRLSEKQIERLLFRSARDGAAPRLDNVHIRRGDFKAALATLKDARSFFGAL